jgi:hypothetical protein
MIIIFNVRTIVHLESRPDMSSDRKLKEKHERPQTYVVGQEVKRVDTHWDGSKATADGFQESESGNFEIRSLFDAGVHPIDYGNDTSPLRFDGIQHGSHHQVETSTCLV